MLLKNITAPEYSRCLKQALICIRPLLVEAWGNSMNTVRRGDGSASVARLAGLCFLRTGIRYKAQGNHFLSINTAYSEAIRQLLHWEIEAPNKQQATPRKRTVSLASIPSAINNHLC